MANTQSGNTDPWFVDRSTDGAGLGVSSRDARHAIGALGQPSPGAGYGFGTNVIPGSSSGAGAPTDLVVTPSSGMTVAVGPGADQVSRGASVGPYIGAATSTVTLTVPAANGSNPRIDYVVHRDRDPGLETTSESSKFVILSGSPSANPVAPDNQLTTGDEVLAAITVRTNTSSILATDIADRRLFGVARGGIYPAWNADTRDGAYEGQYRDNGPYNQLERWSGSAWEAVAVPSVWNQWTPRLLCTGTANDINIGTGATYVGRFQLVGRRLDFNYLFRWGTAPYNGGTGNIYTILPKHPVTGAQLYGVPYDQWFMAELWVHTAQWTGDFFGQALLSSKLSTIQPYFPICSGHWPTSNPVNLNTAPYRIATTAGVTDGKSSVPQIFNPSGFPEGGQLVISGSCEVTWT